MKNEVVLFHIASTAVTHGLKSTQNRIACISSGKIFRFSMDIRDEIRGFPKTMGICTVNDQKALPLRKALLREISYKKEGEKARKIIKFCLGNQNFYSFSTKA